MTAYTEADVERLATVIHDARVGGISYGNYTLARWILDRWPVEETGRRWVFSLDSKPDVVMADGVHRYWSTHCRHGNHDLCKGACKGCAAMCICGCGCGCDPRPVEGSTPIASPPLAGLNVHVADVPDDTIIVGDFGEFARAAREGRSVNPKAFAAIKNVAAPAGEVVSVPPPGKIEQIRAWLRYHGDYDVRIRLWSLYGTIGITVVRLATEVWDDMGTDWDKRLNRALAYLHSIDPPAGTTAAAAPVDEPAPVPPPVDALLPLPPKWTRPAATEAHNIRDVLAAPQRTVPPDDHWDDRPFVEWQAAAIQQVMYRAIDDAHAAGVALGRRQATEDLTAWLDQLAARLPQYNSELSVCTRRANAQVLGAYERAATIARSGLDRNPHCSNCGDTRGGPRGHETSECTWDMWRWPDLLAVPRDAPATEESTEERCDLPGEHEPHDYDVDAPAGEWRHCDGAAVTEATHG